MNALDQIILDPLLPAWLLGGLALLLGAGTAVMALRSPRLAAPRALVALLLVGVIANPVKRTERRAERADVAIAVMDRSASMRIGTRAEDAAAALAAFRGSAPDVEWQIVNAEQQPGEPTRLGAAIERAAGEAPPGRLAGIVVLSDGISADAPDPRLLPGGAPLHHLVIGERQTRDRRLIVRKVPSYSVAGQSAAVTVEIDDGGGGGTALLTQEAAGGRRIARQVPVGEPVTFRIPISRRGIVEVALSAAPLPGGEATLVNNRALLRLNGVTDRLRVLLVSGVPYPGGRAWRDILKSDPNVDLVHFTILRLPTSFDTTPPEQMSLIPFPVEELFEKHLPDFDLIIFDRFGLSELLSPLYFQALADRVRAGGGLLVVTGEEFAAPGGLAETALARLFPVRPAGPPIETQFRPALSDTGDRHPVTAELRGAWGSADWGRWASQSDVAARGGQVLMTGAGGRPLLVLDRVGGGRVGVIASTNVWWWSRGVDGGGPHKELLRRTAHWLMGEPDLDENQLAFTARSRTLLAEARGISPPATGVLTGPDGRSRTVDLARPAGVASSFAAADDGLYRLAAGGRTRFALAGDTAEFAEVRPRAAPIDAAARASGGGTVWLQDRLPRIRRTEAGEPQSGPGWFGLVRNRSGAIVAVDTDPLVPPSLALALLIGALVFAWWRERA